MSCDITDPPVVEHVMSCDHRPFSCSESCDVMCLLQWIMLMSCDITDPPAVDHVMSCDL